MELANQLVHSKDEIIRIVLGQEYLQSIMTGSGFEKGSIVLTDRRVYQVGKAYYRTPKGMKKLKSNTTLDISDVTGVTVEVISDFRRWLAIIFGVLFLAYIMLEMGEDLGDILEDAPYIAFMFLIPFAQAFYAYIKYKPKKYLLIQYAGGTIAFEHTWYSESDINAFQKAVFEEKDRIKSEGHVQVQQPVQEPLNQSSYIEELKQLAELRDNGLITDEQFESKRNQLMSN